MKNLTEELMKKLAQLSRDVKQRLYKEGLVVPVKNKDGSISFGTYRVLRDASGYYKIVDYSNEAVVDQINLPQTAVVVANGMALGRYRDTDLINEDKGYGYADFEEQLYKKNMARKDSSLDKFDVSLGKYTIVHAKKKTHKAAIDKSFEKLTKLI
jgi:hypothetical protein